MWGTSINYILLRKASQWNWRFFFSDFKLIKISQVHQNMIESTFFHLKPHNNNWYLVSKHNKFHPIDIVYMKLQTNIEQQFDYDYT